ARGPGRRRTGAAGAAATGPPPRDLAAWVVPLALQDIEVIASGVQHYDALLEMQRDRGPIGDDGADPRPDPSAEATGAEQGGRAARPPGARRALATRGLP